MTEEASLMGRMDCEGSMQMCDNERVWREGDREWEWEERDIVKGSVKNFQIVPYKDGVKRVNIRGCVMQFGRKKDDTFHMEV